MVEAVYAISGEAMKYIIISQKLSSDIRKLKTKSKFGLKCHIILNCEKYTHSMPYYATPK